MYTYSLKKKKKCEKIRPNRVYQCLFYNSYSLQKLTQSFEYEENI